MKKRLMIYLCTFALACGLTACGSNSEDLYGGRTEDDYKTELSDMMESLVPLDEASVDYNISYISSYEDGAILVGLLEDYKECYDENNEYVGLGEFNVEKSGKTITATMEADFSKRDLKMTFVYSTLDPATPTAMNIEPIYSLGEIMQKAGLNTVMGILIVFFMLVVMSGVIKCFEIIPMLEKRAKEKNEEPTPVAPVVSTEARNETDDLQLVAVIAAAIAASTGASTDSFVVRSIKKRH
ncbi:MAG: OadG family protein [Pseudobutyrivibrio sp.]|nr:OadG family protein [Pseudobutyrivibrio sp.]